MLHPPTFKSSIRLYGLVKDGVGGQPSQVSVAYNANGSQAICAFVSRLDAEIAIRACGLEDYQVRPLSQFFDPNPYLSDQGWLAMHICCGFAANHEQLLETGEGLIPMGWLTHAHIVEWTAEHYLNWGEQLSHQLQTLYDRAGLRNYNALLNEFDGACAAEMRWHTDEALHVMPPRFPSSESPSQFALFDAIECRWCFGNSNKDVPEPHTKIPSQGALS
ncbi:hypothetical protein ACIGKL_04365 [Pseudomonas sp. NPDC077186]|uniref:hypothetical protein n=1 Tax=Pseudomonas sp. NPDC077186 TaxID=3364421 RepID=UPI0037C59C44